MSTSLRIGGDQPSEPKSFCTHIVDYFSSADGPADLLKAIQLSAQYMQVLPLSREQWRVADSVRDAASDGWSMLVWADVVAEGTKFYQKTDELIRVFCNPSLAQRDEGISHLAKQTLLQGVDFLNTVSEGSLLMHNKKWVDMGKCAPWICGVFEGTSLISDGVDASNQWDLMNQIRTVRQGNLVIEVEEIAALDLRGRLCLVRLVKDGASIVLSIAGLAIMLSGIAVEGSALLMGLLLVLSTIFLVTKIFAHFYERVVVERLPPLPSF